MSDLTTMLAMGALLGLVLIAGVVTVALRRRDHERRESSREREDHAMDEGG